jgi:hypothetical protein
MRKWITAAAFALVLVACAPGFDTTPGPTVTTQPAPIGQAAADLATARALWASTGADDYTYEFMDDCGECDPVERSPRRIAVLDGQILAVEDADLLTIEDVFGNIEQALNAGRQVEVTYDKKTGFPRDVQIDMDLRPVDGGSHWILADVTELTPIDSAAGLREARRVWDAQGLDNYQYLIKVVCDCPENGAFEVTVIDGRAVGVVPLYGRAESNTISPVTISSTFDDLEEWFTDTQTVIDEGILELDVRVDPVMGYPRWVHLKADFPDDDYAAPFKAVVTIDLVTSLDPTDSPIVPNADDLAGLLRARGLWEASRTDDYQFTLTVHCMCTEEYTGPFEITVRDERVVSATWQGKPLGPDQGAARTVEDVFALIDRAISDGIDIDVTYDAMLGYPQFVTIDVEAVAVDGGLAFTIDNLIPVGKEGGIAGLVLAGPTCPVQQDPPDPACADRPVANAVLVVFNLGDNEVGRIVTTPDGYFEVSLAPGWYRIEPQPVEGLLGTAPSFEVEIRSGVTNTVSVTYDTGIR